MVPGRGKLSGSAEMLSWLIGLAVARAAPGTTWTDIAQTGAAGVAAVGVVAGLWFSGSQIRKSRLEQTAQRA